MVGFQAQGFFEIAVGLVQLLMNFAQLLLAERVQGTGGLIAVDARGQVGMARNTNAMPYAYAIDDGQVVSGQ